MASTRRCPQCGAELAQDVAQGLCPKCLMKAGLGSRTEAGEAGVVASPAQGHVPPEAGKTFGAYRLVRLLGQGGMGAVYEAEQSESGRRVALKILSQSLDSAEARARFLREGRLAASINHPNSVYIYGTEEIEGTPAIAMELVPGGTLEDRVKQKGPMPAPEAVDAILQIIEGLEAAQAVGVLHRDVKPSNCFIENDGTVKVGDFGLSISTKGRAETNLTVSGTFMGTPAFSSPEQLKGDELDVRSDIYAVGITLYYLLTGKTPFKADNLVRFVATVLERPAESPATLRRDIPKGLCAAVLRCLEKLPARRFRNYGELRAALLPYAAAAPTPATLGWRVLAYIIDIAIWSAVASPVGYLLMTRTGWPTDPAGYSPLVVTVMAGGFVLWVLYWALTEGVRGASPGKAVCRLRVVGPGRSVPGVPRALLRAVIFMVLPVLPTWLYLGFDPGKAFTLASQPTVSMALSFSQFALIALLFATVRRRNGFAGLHDLASGTRVIQKAAYEARPALQPEEQPQPVSEATPKIGPYYVLDRLEKTEAGELLLGYDARLLRKVWIRRLPDGTPPAAAGVRGLGRATRLRWLGGVRAAGENWDAYEAPAGKPLPALIARPQPWRMVRYWLMDLAEELAAALKDGSVPAALALDRVWITAGGRAKLLDFAAPGTGGEPVASREPASAATDFQAARAFLGQVAVAALEGRIVDADAARGKTPAAPLPLHARKFLTELPAFEGVESLLGGLKPLLQKVASVTPRRRLGLVAACAALPIFMAGTMLLGQYAMRCWMESQPDILPLQVSLLHLTAMEKQTGGEDHAKKVHAMEVFIAGRFGKAISDPATWSTTFAAAITLDMREKARQIVAKYPNPSEKELAEAKAVVDPMVDGDVMNSIIGRSPVLMAAMQAGFMTLPLAIVSIVCAIAFRSGLAMLIFGVVAVKRDGSQAGRLRVFWRALVTWSPYVLGFIGLVALGLWLFGKPTDAGDMNVVLGSAGGLALGLFAVLAIVSALLPERGLQDRLAGTWLVPR
ncbi:MAG: protein kinase [Planctomycetota bacterium]|nr:protein kinase [Planctomycetota bacterium]